MSRLLKLTAGLLVVPVLAFSGLASAQTGDPQIERGDIYRVKNVTKGSDFVDTASADAGDSLTYKVRIHNPGEACLTNVVVKAVLPSSIEKKNVSTVTVKADKATTNFVTDTATVELSSAQKISFVPGSVQLLNSNGGVISTISDSVVTGNGANIGKACVSVNEKRFVQFNAKVSKPEQPKPEQPKPEQPKPEQPKPEKPQVKAEVGKGPEVLPSAGAGQVIGMFAGASAAGAAAHYAVRRFRGDQ